MPKSNLYKNCTKKELKEYQYRFLFLHRALYKEAMAADRYANGINARYNKTLKAYDAVTKELKNRI